MVAVSDDWHLLLVLSFLLAVVVLLSAWWRKGGALTRVVLCLELGFIVVFWWNSTVPAVAQLVNPLYFVVATSASAIIINGVWSSVGGFVLMLILLFLAGILLLVGRDKLSSEFTGGLSDTVLASIFVVISALLLAFYRWAQSWTRLWLFVNRTFMGIGLGLSIDVITQENPTTNFNNTNLDLLNFTDNVFLAVLFSSITVYHLISYRHRVFPCWFKPPPSSPPPSKKKKRKKSFLFPPPDVESGAEETLYSPLPE